MTYHLDHHWKDALFWVLAVLVALLLAIAAPSERLVMGSVPPVSAQDLNHRPLDLPHGLEAERTLALIGFERGHAGAVDSWIKGLNLHQDTDIAWVRMPVLNDPGDEAGRMAIERRLQSRFPNAAERARLVPVFTDRDAFIRSAGLASTEQAYAVVLSRSGEVLARAEGAFDAERGQALLETLRDGRAHH
jgi:hypothetical protein